MKILVLMVALIAAMGCIPAQKPVPPISPDLSPPTPLELKVDSMDKIRIEGSGPTFYLVEGRVGTGIVFLHSSDWSGEIALTYNDREDLVGRDSPGISSAEFWEEGVYLLRIEPTGGKAYSMDIAVGTIR